jgi:hypothetical protein
MKKGDWVGANNPRWKGGTYVSNGYRMVQCEESPFANAQGYVFEHVMIASSVLGRQLPVSAKVHHVNGNPLDNKKSNLVICENQAYHLLLHQRQRAVYSGYPPTYLRCPYCKKYDLPENLWKSKTTAIKFHQSCRNENRRNNSTKRKTSRGQS